MDFSLKKIEMKVIIFSFVIICVYVGIHEVHGVPAKFKYTTPPPEEPESEDHDEDEGKVTDKDEVKGADEDEGKGADEDDTEKDESHKYMTPQCIKTLTKYKGDLDNIKHKSTEEMTKLIQDLNDGGCKPLLDYWMQKDKKKG